MKKHNSKKKYSEAIQRLQEIASNLESGEISIDSLEDIIQESRLLVTMCQDRLRRLESRIEGQEEE